MMTANEHNEFIKANYAEGDIEYVNGIEFEFHPIAGCAPIATDCLMASQAHYAPKDAFNIRSCKYAKVTKAAAMRDQKRQEINQCNADRAEALINYWGES